MDNSEDASLAKVDQSLAKAGDHPEPATQERGLSPKQLVALNALKQGYNVSQASAIARINRTTLSDWVNHHATFKAAWQAWQSNTLNVSVRGILVAAAPVAARRLARSARTDDKAAATLLKGLGALNPDPVHPPKAAAEIQDEEMLAEQKRRIERDELRENLLDKHLKTAFRRGRRDAMVKKVEADGRAEQKALPATEPKPFPPEDPAKPPEPKRAEPLMEHPKATEPEKPSETAALPPEATHPAHQTPPPVSQPPENPPPP